MYHRIVQILIQDFEVLAKTTNPNLEFSTRSFLPDDKFDQRVQLSSPSYAELIQIQVENVILRGRS